MMKANEIRNMTTAELEAKLVELKKDLFFLRMQHATNQLGQPRARSLLSRKILPASKLLFVRKRLGRSEEVSNYE